MVCHIYGTPDRSGQPCRPGQILFFEGPRPAPPARILLALAAPQKKKSGRPARPAWLARPAWPPIPYFIYLIQDLRNFTDVSYPLAFGLPATVPNLVF